MKKLIYLVLICLQVFACIAQTKIKKIRFPIINVEVHHNTFLIKYNGKWILTEKAYYYHYTSFVGVNYCLPFAQRWWLEGGVRAGIYNYRNIIYHWVPNPNGPRSTYIYEDRGDTTEFIKGVNVGVCYRAIQKPHFQLLLAAKLEVLEGFHLYFEPTFCFPIKNVMLFARPYYGSSNFSGVAGLRPVGLGIGCYFGTQDKLFKARGKK